MELDSIAAAFKKFSFSIRQCVAQSGMFRLSLISLVMPDEQHRKRNLLGFHSIIYFLAYYSQR